MTPAERVISKFGGQTALADAINKRQSTVQHWAKTGLIPAKWYGHILKRATALNIDLSASDLVEEVEVLPPAAAKPVAKWWGDLQIGNAEIPVYVLDDGRRVLSRTGATGLLTGGKGGGNLESYLGVRPLEAYLPADLPDHMIEFEIQGVVNKTVRGILADTFLTICRAYIKARDARADGMTPRQIGIAIQAGMFLSACAGVGLTALIDEATGYQYARTEDALRVKLKLYLEDEMRKWEKTFPDELWKEFARLTNWSGSVTQRPKYWGKLVMELVYGYLDPDVAEWLKKNAPRPRGGQNYHQWLSSQYGLKRLVEHLWMLVGMASACYNMAELRQKMAEKFGREPVQFTLYLPPADLPVRAAVAKQPRRGGADSGANRSPIPIQTDPLISAETDHRFQSKPITLNRG